MSEGAYPGGILELSRGQSVSDTPGGLTHMPRHPGGVRERPTLHGRPRPRRGRSQQGCQFRG
jgi:hypothetical protein